MCVLANVVLYNQTLYYLVAPSATPPTRPAVHVSLRPDEMLPTTLRPVVVRQTNLPFAWEDVKVNICPVTNAQRCQHTYYRSMRWTRVCSPTSQPRQTYSSCSGNTSHLCTTFSVRRCVRAAYVYNTRSISTHLTTESCTLQHRYRTILLNTAPFDHNSSRWSQPATDAFTCIAARTPLWIHHPDVCHLSRVVSIHIHITCATRFDPRPSSYARRCLAMEPAAWAMRTCAGVRRLRTADGPGMPQNQR